MQVSVPFLHWHSGKQYLYQKAWQFSMILVWQRKWIDWQTYFHHCFHHRFSRRTLAYIHIGQYLFGRLYFLQWFQCCNYRLKNIFVLQSIKQILWHISQYKITYVHYRFSRRILVYIDIGQYLLGRHQLFLYCTDIL